MVQNKCSLVIIGCSILFALVDDLSEMQKQSDKLSRLTQMELGNLGKEDVNRAIMPMSSIDDASTTQGFATEGLLGNSFFLLERLSVEAQGLLQCAACLGASLCCV
uniref:Uncharacterized protein n=1 Tax=Ditylum brightwellii TaxID=49249 RepID=A0A7S4RXD0_9STRA